MARIQRTDIYNYDISPSAPDFLVGSDTDDGKVTKSYRLDAIFAYFEQAGFVTEAPNDGNPYVRQSEGWVLMPTGGASGDVFSVFGRIGAVTAQVADYAAFYSQLGHTHTESEISDWGGPYLPLAGGTMAGNIIAGSNNITGTKILGFDTATAETPAAGQLTWDGDENTVSLGINGIHTHLTHDTMYHARNNSGVVISKGDAIMATGTLGASGRITIAKFVNNGSVDPKYFMGVAAEDIANGSDGKVFTFGKIRQIDTTGTPYGETWIAGDIIYASPTTAGYLTKTEPSAPSYKGEIGIVINSAANGTLFVRVKGNEGIHSLHDAQITSAVSGHALMYNGTIWANRALVEADISDLQSYILDAPSDGNYYGRRNGAWAQVNNVTSVFGRTGAVTAVVGDYSAFYSQLGHTHLKADITDFSVDIADINALGTPGITTYLRGDGNWATVATNLTSLSDVTLTTPANQHALMYNGSLWVNRLLTNSDISDLSSYTGFDARYYTETEIDTLSIPYKESVSTGIVSGGVISINGGDNTKFDIAAGVGYIVDHTVSPPTVTTVSFGPFTAQTVTNLATKFSTDIAINAAGAIIQQDSFTDAERRQYIMLGGLDHSNKTNILRAFQIQSPIAAPASSVQELSRALGDINIDGNVYTANGANLNINKTGGTVYSFGRGNTTSELEPHKVVTGSGTAISFGYVFDNGSGTGSFTVPGTSIDPNNYDNGSGTLAAVPANRFTIQRFLYFPNGDTTFVQYGTTTYVRKQDAEAAVATISFPALNGIKTALVRGYLIVRQGETDLTSSDTEFYSSNKFGSVIAGSSVTTFSGLTDTNFTALAKGDIAVFDGTEWVDLTVGANDSVLTADSAQATGLKWATPVATLAGLTDTTITGAAKGDLLVYNGTAWVDLTVGSDTQVLTADSLEATGLKWAAAAGGATQLSDLSDVVSATNTNRFVLVANGTTGYVGRALVEADISDLQSYYLASNPSGYTSNTGTVTSVAATVPTGISVSGSPITTAGTLAFTWTAGYQGYTTTEASKLAGIESGATADQAWGDITGTLSSQTDLQSALDAKVDVAGDTMTGTLIIQGGGVLQLGNATTDGSYTLYKSDGGAVTLAWESNYFRYRVGGSGSIAGWRWDNFDNPAVMTLTTGGDLDILDGLTTGGVTILGDDGGNANPLRVTGTGDWSVSTATSQCYITGRDSTGDNYWYLGNASASHGDIILYSYPAAHFLSIKESGTLAFSGPAVDFAAAVVDVNDVRIDDVSIWYVSSSDAAHQRADARDDATTEARLHWYGVTDTGTTSTFKHAWYDGTNYMDIDYASDILTWDSIGQPLTFKIKSNVDANLIVESDADNVTETDNPTIQMWQDGATVKAIWGIEGAGGAAFSGAAANSPYFDTVAASGWYWAINGVSRMSLTATELDLGTQALHVDGIILQDSSDRAGLLEISGVNTTRAYYGIQIKDDGGKLWSLMANATVVGIYDDSLSEWHITCTQNSHVRLYYNGSIKLETTNTGLTVTGTGVATDWQATSDERVKTDIQLLDREAPKVDWKQFYINGEDRMRYGAIAQEVEKTHPELVTTNDEGIKALSYTDLLVLKMAEKDKQIEELTDRLDKLEGLVQLMMK